MRQLLLRLTNVEARRLERASRVERLAAVDSGRLSEERLREDEPHDLAILFLRKVEAGASKIVVRIVRARDHGTGAARGGGKLLLDILAFDRHDAVLAPCARWSPSW